MLLTVDIDPHGRVVPQSEEARRALADRAGRFAVLPAAADLLVARRTPPAGGAGARPRCILAGDLAGFPIADFVAFVHQARLSGVLTVASAGAERQVAFKEGEVRSAGSTAPGERLPDVAVRLGLATAAQVAKLPREVPAAKALAGAKVLAPAEVRRCLVEQAAAVFHAILLAPEGTFFLVDEDPAERSPTPLAVSTQTLLMDGIRRIDEMSLFRARIPGPGAFVRRREPARPPTLKPPELELLALVDGRRTVADLAAAAHLNEFDAVKLLFHLAEAGCVEATQAPEAPGAAPATRAGAIADAMNEVFRAVLSAVPGDGRAALVSAVRAHLGDARNPWAPLLARLFPGQDGALDTAALLGALSRLEGAALARLEPSGDPDRLVAAALEDVLYQYLFLAGERLSPSAEDALAEVARRRLAAIRGDRAGAAP